MAETSGFFNAEELEDGTYDREYFAQQFAHYFAQFIGNGIYMTEATMLQVSQNAALNMSADINIGDAFINGYWYSNSSVLTLLFENASSVYSRIDSVRLRWTSTDRKINAVIVKGTEANSPVSPPLVRDDGTYDLELARVTIARAQTGITDGNISDMRLDSDVCGIVQGVVQQIDFTTLFKQYSAWFEEWFADVNARLGDEPATNLQLQIDGLKNDQVLVATGFSSSAPYTTTIDVPNLLTTDAIEAFINLIPSYDDDRTTAEKAAVLKSRRQQLAKVDDISCNEDGKLVLTALSKQPSTFEFWLRGGSTGAVG